MIDKKYKHLSVRSQCRLLDLNRSTLYAPLKPLAEDTELGTALGRYIKRRPPVWLSPHSCPAGSRRKACKPEAGVSLDERDGSSAIYPKPKTTIRGKQATVYPYLLGGLEIEKPHQVWQVDITYLRPPGGFVYLTCLIDVYSRAVVEFLMQRGLFRGFGRCPLAL